MYKLSKLKNGLTLITIDLPTLQSVTSLVAVDAGSRYETKRVNGISHFLEHMFFKGSKKYPTAEQIATLVDGIGAINNAATSKEYTYYWIKSASKHVELAADLLSSMLKESLIAEVEMEREKGVIVEELRMYRDNPTRFVWDLYENLQFGDQPLGWDIGGDEKTINSLKRQDFIDYMKSLYSPSNMVLVFAGKLPEDIDKLATDYFADLPENSHKKFLMYKKIPQSKPRVNIFHKKTDQTNLVLGVEGFDRKDSKRYAARVLSVILGEGMSSRLFIQVRERRGLAYHVSADSENYHDTGMFTVYAGLKFEKTEEGLQVILDELRKITTEKVMAEEIKKAKESIRGRLALRAESTNFLAEYHALNYILEGEVETFEEYLKKIDLVSADDIQAVAKELFRAESFNLQIIAPFENGERFEKMLNSF